jgi:hypothetical protein
MNMAKKSRWVVVAVTAIGLCVTGGVVSAADCKYNLNPASDQPGTVKVEIKGKSFKIEFKGAKPNTLYTIWTDFRNRATLAKPADYPETGETRGVAPTFATNAGVTEGIGQDPNSVFTDKKGNGKLSITLDYKMLAAGSSPVVAKELSMQGANRVGGTWLRLYPEDPQVKPSRQRRNPNFHVPQVHLATAQGITVVGHFDDVSHGHTPGVNGVDFFSGYSGDFPSECLIAAPVGVDDVCDADNIATLVFEYTGEKCSASMNAQTKDSCLDGPQKAQPQPVRIVASNSDGGGGQIWADTLVLVGDEVRVDAAFAGKDKLSGSGTTFTITDKKSNVFQMSEVRTDCKEPLDIDDQFGGLILRDFVPEK